MLEIAFKNLDPSQLVRDAVADRILPQTDKFPHLKAARIRITVEMENSPQQAGPDNFSVKLQILSGVYRGIVLSKKRENFYLALADITDLLLETLNHRGDRTRVRKLKAARQHKVRQNKAGRI
jgi:hypothetical protein